MPTSRTRSEEVITDYKQRKLTQSALCRIQDLMQQFEDERAFDRRAAVLGVIALLVLVGVSLALLFSDNSLLLH